MVESAARFFDGLPWLALTATSLVVAAPVVLVHELGHCIVALRICEGPVLVKVGRSRPLTRFRLGRVWFELHPIIPLRALRAGFCAFRPPRTRIGVISIALGGPAASIIAAAVALAAATSAGAGSTARAVLVLVAVLSAWAGLANLLPRTKTRNGIKARTDGGLVLDALRGPVFALPEPPGGWLRRPARQERAEGERSPEAVAWPGDQRHVAHAYLAAFAARDYSLVGSLLADDFRLRDLSPGGFTQVDGADAAMAGLRRFLDRFTSVELGEAEAYEIADVTYLRARVRFVDAAAGERFLEQHHLLRITDRGIAGVDELCTGLHAP